jgi:hypothetical protein
MSNDIIINFIRKKDSAWTGITLYRKSMLPQPSKTTRNVFWVAEECILVEFWHKKKRSVLFVITVRPFRNFVVHWLTKTREEKDLPATRQFTAKLYSFVHGEDSVERLASSPLSILQFVPSPVDLTSFRGLEVKMRGQHYATNTAVQEAVRICWRRAEKKFCPKGIFRLLEGWQKFIDYGWDFLEKWIRGRDLTDTWCFLFIRLLVCKINMLMWHGPCTWLIDVRIATQWAGLLCEGLRKFVTRTSLTLNKTSFTLWAICWSQLSCARCTVILWLKYSCAPNKSLTRNSIIDIFYSFISTASNFIWIRLVN